MVDRIFEDNDGRYIEPKQRIVTYDLKPSPKLASIRTAVVRRFAEKRKQQVSLSDDDSTVTATKKTKIELDLNPSGLPSPPSEEYVQSPELKIYSKAESSNADTAMEEGATIDPQSATQQQSQEQSGNRDKEEVIEQETPGLSVIEITQKLEELKREKHELFQLMKQLMRQEQIDKQQQMEAERRRREEQQQRQQAEETEKRRLEAEKILKQQQQQRQREEEASKAALLSPPDETIMNSRGSHHFVSAPTAVRRFHGRSPPPSPVPNDSRYHHPGANSSRKVKTKKTKDKKFLRQKNTNLTFSSRDIVLREPITLTIGHHGRR